MLRVVWRVIECDYLKDYVPDQNLSGDSRPGECLSCNWTGEGYSSGEVIMSV